MNYALLFSIILNIAVFWYLVLMRQARDEAVRGLEVSCATIKRANSDVKALRKTYEEQRTKMKELRFELLAAQQAVRELAGGLIENYLREEDKDA